MHVTLVVPALLALPHEALQATPALGRLAADAMRVAPDADSALLRALALDVPAAPLAALGAGVDVGTRWVMRADPVTMTVSHDDVRVDARVDDLDQDERATLMHLVATHFAADALVFEAPRADAWFVTSEAPFELETTPVDAAIGRPLRDRLPAGRDAARWRRWMTEAQMLLHEHPLASRQRPVNALWFSHAGRLPATWRPPAISAYGRANRTRDVAAGIARSGGARLAALTTCDELLAGAHDAIAVVEPLQEPEGLARVARAWLDPLVAALDARRIAALTIVADGGGAAASWRVSPRRWLDRLRGRRSRFEPPRGVRR
jgi:hypothetical protein